MNNKKLEELFQLPESSDMPELAIDIPEEEFTDDTLSTIEKIENALPQVKKLEATDEEMDELAELAKNSYKDLMDLGMQSDPRHQAEIFSSAGNMLGHAITAKTAKINKKLKTIELQLKKAALDAKLAAKNEEVDNTPLGEGKSFDRNELLKMLNGKNND